MIYIALGCKVSSINFSFNSILVSNLRTCFVGYAFYTGYEILHTSTKQPERFESIYPTKKNAKMILQFLDLSLQLIGILFSGVIRISC